MKNFGVARRYWEQKILRWEKLRYSSLLLFYPLSWTIRYRLYSSIKILNLKIRPDWTVCELGCGSGILANVLSKNIRKYHGVDIASCAIEYANEKYSSEKLSFEVGDVLDYKFEKFDLYIFLGLTDWLEPKELGELFLNIKTDNVFFSYTESRVLSPWNPYQIYRSFTDKEIIKDKYQALTYNEEEIRKYLELAGFKMTVVKKASSIDPGVLVWGQK